jgi:hypothetical protein
MRHVGHSVRCVTIESLKFVWIGTDNHQMWANVELMPGATLRRFPGAEIGLDHGIGHFASISPQKKERFTNSKG